MSKPTNSSYVPVGDLLFKPYLRSSCEVPTSCSYVAMSRSCGPTVHARNVREKVLFPYINDHVLTYFYSFLQEKCKIEKGLF